MCQSFVEASEQLYGKEWVAADRAACGFTQAPPDPARLHRWHVFVDVDAKGGDDDVFQVRATVEAYTEAEVKVKGEDLAAGRYGRHKVLGAYDARLAENQNNIKEV